MLEKEATEKSKYDAEQLAEAAKEATEKSRYEDEQKTKNNIRKSEDLMGSDGVVRRHDVGPDGRVYLNGVEVGNRSDYTKAPTKTQETKGGSGYGDNLDNRAIPKLETMGQANRVAKIGNTLSPESKAKLNDSSDLLKQVMLRSFSPRGAAALIKNRFSGYDQDAKDFIVSISRLSAEERHKLFGSALTQTEKESAQDFMDRVEGLSLDQMLSRLGDTYRANEDSLITYDNVGNGTSYADIVARSNWNQFDKSVGVPGGGEELASEIAEIDSQIAKMTAEIEAAEQTGSN
jgi:hypothetical protein